MVATKQATVKKRKVAPKKATLPKKSKSPVIKKTSAWEKHDGLFASDPYFKDVMAEVAKKRKTLKA